MTCAHCGAEIADNALICYRCGEATTEPVHAPADLTQPTRGRVSRQIGVGLVFLVAAVFFLWQQGTGATVEPLVWGLLGIAGALLVWRLWPRSRG